MEEKQWVERYYRELDRAKRAQILEEAVASEGMTPENELRRKLLDARYSENNGQMVDYFIRGWMNMYFLKSSSKSFFGPSKKKTRRELDSIRSDWQMDLAEQYGEDGRRVLYEEFCNMTLVYMSLCHTDKNYGSILLGIGHMKDESLVAKIARDIYTLAYEVPDQTDTAEEFRLFTEAATAMFCEKYSSQQNELMDRVRNRN